MSKIGRPKKVVEGKLHAQEKPGPRWPEDPAAKLQWMLEQRAFIQNKPDKSEDERLWLVQVEPRISLLRIAL